MTVNSQAVIDFYVKRLNKANWDVMFIMENGVQVKKKKSFSRLGFWTGLLLLPFWGIGFVIWILAILDYILKQEKVIFISVDQMIEQMKEAR